MKVKHWTGLSVFRWDEFSSSLTEHAKLYQATAECVVGLTLKGPGAESAPPPRHFLLYLSRLLFFLAETS